MDEEAIRQFEAELKKLEERFCYDEDEDEEEEYIKIKQR